MGVLALSERSLSPTVTGVQKGAEQPRSSAKYHDQERPASR